MSSSPLRSDVIGPGNKAARGCCKRLLQEAVDKLKLIHDAKRALEVGTLAGMYSQNNNRSLTATARPYTIAIEILHLKRENYFPIGCSRRFPAAPRGSMTVNLPSGIIARKSGRS